MGWIEPGGGVGGRPGCQLLRLLGAVSNPSPPAARSRPWAQRRPRLAGHLPLARGGQGRPRDRQVAEPEKPVRLGACGAQAWVPWEVKQVFPLQNSREENREVREEQRRRPRPQAVSQQGSDHDITPSRRHAAGGTAWATARQRGQTGRQRSQGLGSQVRTGPGQRPLCTYGLACGRRYLTRFSTEYTDM